MCTTTERLKKLEYDDLMAQDTSFLFTAMVTAMVTVPRMYAVANYAKFKLRMQYIYPNSKKSLVHHTPSNCEIILKNEKPSQTLTIGE